ncbi:MAG TPA: bifunctional 4-hydroxy-2-oxoglutarate aldolase/2-dehydro-3-deoxy-phosphogluconate aldolase, partial [Mycobacteriales bacterium]|nr:bifunctional 4-hydroxy-2-oxoglutarate aldolase/2-dehydro-3-deoxy-phosphogluconate aldolase [Mycobacteriales bacterium]
MAFRFEIMSAIAHQRVIGIVRAGDAETARVKGRLLLASGLRAVEVSMTTPDALHVIRDLSGGAPPGAYVGAGTVLDGITARLAVNSGATFLVAPSLCEETVKVGHRYGAAVIPGALTPTEIVTAMDYGADAVKLYPASAASVSVLKDLTGPRPQVPFVPTGGVGIDDAADWISA